MKGEPQWKPFKRQATSSRRTRFKAQTSTTPPATISARFTMLMIDKPSGKVAYAIMSFGGFLGMGNQYHPLPWSVLKYNANLGGYVVHLDKRRLEGARLTTLVTNRPGAIALTKVRYTTITGSGLIGLCDCSASQPRLSGVFFDLRWSTSSESRRGTDCSGDSRLRAGFRLQPRASTPRRN